MAQRFLLGDGNAYSGSPAAASSAKGSRVAPHSMASALFDAAFSPTEDAGTSSSHASLDTMGILAAASTDAHATASIVKPAA